MVEDHRGAQQTIGCLLLFMMLAFTSCDYTLLGSMIGDGGLISGKPCRAPCFWNIYPGRTAKDQAIRIIQEHGATGYHQSDTTLWYGDSIYLTYDANSIVQRVDFAPNPAITVKALIAKYGTPDTVDVTYAGLTPEHPYFYAGLYYDRLHARLMLEREEIFPAYSLNPETRITHVTYFSESSYGIPRASMPNVVRWVGYGAYKESVISR
jgi:hypothetical protein